MILLFIGPSGSGKDTQAEMLVEKYGFNLVSTGELFRKEVSSGSDLGKKLKEYMNAGKWVPDELVYKILGEHLKESGSENFVLSGAVRTEEQIPLLDKTLESIEKDLTKVVYFDLSDSEVMRRLSGRLVCVGCELNYHIEFKPPKNEGVCDRCGQELIQRADDYPEAIQKRLDEFHADNQEILTEYRNRGILLTIDASQSIDEIQKVLIKKLGLK